MSVVVLPAGISAYAGLAVVMIVVLALAALHGRRDRRLVALAVAAMATAVINPDFPTKICDWCWFCLECIIPHAR